MKIAATQNAAPSAESHRAATAGANTNVVTAAHAPANSAAASKALPPVPIAKTGDPVLTQTRPDTFAPTDAAKDHTLDSPLQAVGEGWRMVAYLLPMLILIVVCLNLLRRYQQKNGRLPGVMQAAARGGIRPAPPAGAGMLSALFSRNQAVRTTGSGISGIRVLESVPVGAATLHLVQVRGRVLLLSGSGAGVTVLTEFEERPDVESDEFRGLLQAAAADMDGLDLAEADLPVTAVVGSLEDVMRDTGEAMARRLRRLRTVQEAEDAGL